MKNHKEKLKQLNQDVEELWNGAYRDSLTKLYNRAALEDEVLNELNKISDDSNYSFALFYMDLNGFKKVNDTFGHEVGDQLLIAFSDELTFRYKDSSFRLGGDEFIVILSGCPTVDSALISANQLCQNLSKSYRVNEHECHVAPSIGVVFCNERAAYSEDGIIAVREVINQGDIAMYKAKLISKTSLKMPPLQGERPVQGYVQLFTDFQPLHIGSGDHKLVLRSGIGDGRLLADGEPVDCKFRIGQFSDGEIQLLCIGEVEPTAITWGRIQTGLSKNISFEGNVFWQTTHENFVIKCNSLSRINSSLHIGEPGCVFNGSFIADYMDLSFSTNIIRKARFHLANFNWPIDEFGTPNSFNVEIDGYILEFRTMQDMESLKNQIKRLNKTSTADVTAWIQVRLRTESELEKIVDITDDVLTILSFLQGSITNWISYDLLAEDDTIVRSQCRNSVVGKILGNKRHELWSIPFIKAALPRMYPNYQDMCESFDLKRTLAFLSTIKGQEMFIEMRAIKLMYCIERILYNFLKNSDLVEGNMEIPWTQDIFYKNLVHFCNEIDIDILCDEGKSPADMVRIITKEITTIRESLQTIADLRLLDDKPDDISQSQNAFERWRQVEFLWDFVTGCLKKILDPHGDYEIYSCHIADVN